MDTKNFTVFGITSPISQLVKVDDNFNQVRDFEYDDTEVYMSDKLYEHPELGEDIIDNFAYRYAIEAYEFTDDDNNPVTYYTLYLVPAFKSLSEKRKNDVIDFVGVEAPEYVTETDVMDYGMSIVMGRESYPGSYDKAVMDKIASIVDCIDGLRGFYLDKAQNRVGTSGWDMLGDFLKDEDFMKKTLEKWDKQSK